MEDKGLKEQKTKKQMVFWLIPLILFLAFISYVMVRSIPGEVEETIAETPISAQGFSSLSDSFEEVLQEDIYGQTDYINLNGLTTRVLGINSLNERQKLANGYLAYFQDIRKTDYAISGAIELNEFLSERDIPFVYTLAPSKASFYDAEFAPGYSSNSWKNLDTVLDALNEAGVQTIDIDAWCEENGWTMEDTFFKTDHHWLPQTAMQAARLTMETLSEQGLAYYDRDKLDEENWDITILEDWFLGSDGKRTGVAYAGVDDFPVYLPDFPTGYDYAFVRSGTTNWTYLGIPVEFAYLDRIDYFNDEVYGFYLVGNYPIRRITNSEAENDLRVMVIGDSYSRPYEYFLSTQFKELYDIDPRYYTDGSLAEFIVELQPDIVLMCSSENDISSQSLYTTGISDYLSALEETDNDAETVQLGSFSIDANDDDKNNYTVIYDDLEPGQSYTLTLDSTGYSGGEDRFVQFTLQDVSSDEAVYNRYFEANTEGMQKWIFTVPEDAGDEYEIYFYAGVKGHTTGVSAEVTNVSLRKGIFEE